MKMNSNPNQLLYSHDGFASTGSAGNKHTDSNTHFRSGKPLIKGCNDLATLRPDLAMQWHHKRNIGISPENISPSSNKKVWWICNSGHEWKASIRGRSLPNSTCPHCAKDGNSLKNKGADK